MPPPPGAERYVAQAQLRRRGKKEMWMEEEMLYCLCKTLRAWLIIVREMSVFFTHGLLYAQHDITGFESELRDEKEISLHRV